MLLLKGQPNSLSNFQTILSTEIWELQHLQKSMNYLVNTRDYKGICFLFLAQGLQFHMVQHGTADFNAAVELIARYALTSPYSEESIDAHRLPQQQTKPVIEDLTENLGKQYSNSITCFQSFFPSRNNLYGYKAYICIQSHPTHNCKVECRVPHSR